jgi:predicted transcriptional regulator
MVGNDLETFLYIFICIYIGDYMYTSARLEMKTKNELESLKNYSNESLDSVVKRLIQNTKEDLLLSENELDQIEKGIKNIREGKIKTLEEASKEWGI